MATLVDPVSEVYASAVAVWEATIKVGIGKLSLPLDELEAIVAQSCLSELPVTSARVREMRHLPAIHRDPSDRLVVAQARHEGLTLVTRDPKVRRYPIETFVGSSRRLGRSDGRHSARPAASLPWPDHRASPVPAPATGGWPRRREHPGFIDDLRTFVRAGAGSPPGRLAGWSGQPTQPESGAPLAAPPGDAILAGRSLGHVHRRRSVVTKPARAEAATTPQPTPDGRAADASASPLPGGHPALAPQRIGVLLLNLGTPDDTDYWSMRRYLKEFLSDQRVIDVNPLLWKPLLNLVILTTRPARSGQAYAAIWNRERDESPLRTITRDQCAKLAQALGRALPDRPLMVDWAMRYGTPSTGAVIRTMVEAGCTRLLLLALYPQYAAATTATAYDQAFRALLAERWQPAVRTAPPYYEHPMYIDALARSIEGHLARLSWQPEVILASFHGLPKRYLMLGDPYHCQCAKTARLLRERLGWDERRLRMTFQSRFGREEWLRPYTDETVLELARAGVRDLAIVTPGFAADCVETLEEIAIGVRESFLEHGGENFTYVPCLNAADDHITLLADLVRRELAGWI